MARNHPTPMLADDSDELPTGAGWVYEPKWDGLRCLVALDADGTVSLSSPRGKSLNAAFPELVAAAGLQLPADTTVDGAIVCWNDHGEPDFDALERRTQNNRAAKDLVHTGPCHLILFDMLRHDGRDLTPSPLVQRRTQLQRLIPGDDTAAPLLLSQQTADPETAQSWFANLTAAGVEGIMAKREHEPYRSGVRTWVKIKHYTTTQGIVGGITGPLDHIESLILGRIRRADGQLHITGRTGPLEPADAEQVTNQISLAGNAHPWPAELPPVWRERGARNYHRVTPRLVVDVHADTAITQSADQPSHWRHRLPMVRVRTELAAYNVPLDLDLGPG